MMPETLAAPAPPARCRSKSSSDTVARRSACSIDGSGGTTHPNGKPIFTAAQVASYLNRTGGGWVDGTNDSGLEARQNNIGDDNKTITFGFSQQPDRCLQQRLCVPDPDMGGLGGLCRILQLRRLYHRAARRRARGGADRRDDVAAVSFREVSANDADIDFGNLASAPTTQAYAYIPTGRLRRTNGDQSATGRRRLGFAQPGEQPQLDEGRLRHADPGHEIGHALGLSIRAPTMPPRASRTPTGANAEYAQDTRAYSIMSYFEASSSAAPALRFPPVDDGLFGVPLIHDILAVQRIYGADMTTRTGDTTYGFNSNAGRDSSISS